MEIQYGTSMGKVRSNNEDYTGYFYNQKMKPLALLADGMGGHNAGDVASKLLVEAIGELWESTDLTDSDTVSHWLEETIQLQNDRIYHLGESYESMSGMGTTIVAVAVLDQQVVIAHVGDSRVYEVVDGTLVQKTDDHSLVNELLKSGGITEEMAENHPKKNYLTRTVGMKGKIEVDTSIIHTHGTEQFLLCSDGLTNMISNDHILQLMTQQAPVGHKVQSLIEAANQAGGRDNITVLIIDLQQTGGEA